MQELLSEPMGFKYTIGGFTAWFFSLVNNVDVTQMLGFVGLVIGLAIQVSSWFRNRKADRLQDESDAREREADARDIRQYDLQMKVLAKELQELDQRLNNANNK
jgi:HAMP domain-containing protein